MKINPLKTVLTYLVISVLWVVASDQALRISSSGADPDSLRTLQSAKGVAYIVISGALLFFVLRHQRRSFKASEEQYKYLFQSNPNPLWIYDIQSLRFVEVNDAALKAYGYSREEFLSKSLHDISPEEEAPKMEELMGNLPNYFHSGTWKTRKSNGEEFYVSIETHQITFNSRDCYIVLAQDVTERVKQEKKLSHAYELEKELRKELENNLVLMSQSLEENRQLAQIIERVNNIVVVTDPFGVIVWVNRAFEEFTGYSKDEAVGRTTDFLHGADTDPDIQEKIMQELLKNGFVNLEIPNYTKHGKRYWTDINISGFYNDKGVLERYISIQHVITERKEWEDKIRMQNRTLRLMSWINSHAIRKPIASIIGLVNISRESESLEELKEMQALIGECTEELDLIIREIAAQVNRIEMHDDEFEAPPK